MLMIKKNIKKKIIYINVIVIELLKTRRYVFPAIK